MIGLNVIKVVNESLPSQFAQLIALIVQVVNDPAKILVAAFGQEHQYLFRPAKAGEPVPACPVGRHRPASHERLAAGPGINSQQTVVILNGRMVINLPTGNPVRMAPGRAAALWLTGKVRVLRLHRSGLLFWLIASVRKVL